MDEGVWEQIVTLSRKEWEDNFNDDYINHLLSNFNLEKLIFESKDFKQPFYEAPPLVYTSSGNSIPIMEYQII